jgi:hypothetical protein
MVTGPIGGNGQHHQAEAARTVAEPERFREIGRVAVGGTGGQHFEWPARARQEQLDGRAEKGLHLHRNEIHDAPYSGIVLGGRNHLIEENLIYRVMREMQDGGVIYGGVTNCTLRGNMVRDIVKMGEGYGVSSYYLDEGARDCLIEHNVSVGVTRPMHNHIATNTIIRDNVFISEGETMLSF